MQSHYIIGHVKCLPFFQNDHEIKFSMTKKHTSEISNMLKCECVLGWFISCSSSNSLISLIKSMNRLLIQLTNSIWQCLQFKGIKWLCWNIPLKVDTRWTLNHTFSLKLRAHFLCWAICDNQFMHDQNKGIRFHEFTFYNTHSVF